MAMDEMYPAIPGDEGSFHVSRWEDLTQARSAVHTECYDNSAALYGDVFTTWDDTFRRYVDSLRGHRSGEVLFDINKIESMMAARDSFITGDGMTIYIHSTTDETIGSQRARKAQQVARAHWEEHDMWSKYLGVREWCKSCGTAFMRIYYDPSGGKRIKGSKLFEGVVKASPMSLWQVAWDPLADEWDQVRYAYVASVKPIEELQARGWELDWKKVLKDSEKNAWISQHEQYIRMQKPELGNVRAQRDEKGKQRNVSMLEYFEKPTNEHPQGQYLVIVGRQIVKETPLEVGVIPIVPFYDTRKAGTIIAQTPVKKMRPLQEAINRLGSKLYERSQIPDIIGVPSGWPTEPRKFAGKAFIVGELQSFGSANVSPTYTSGGQIRQDHLLLFNLYEGEMEKAASVSSLATAQPKGNWSGRFGYIVTDSNKKLLSKITYGFKKSVEQTERLILQFINKYYTEERTAKYISESDMREVVRYRGTDIGTDWTLEVSLSINLTDDPVTIAQMTLQYLSIPMIAQKVIENPVAFKKATEMINAEFAQKLFSGEQDTGVADDENFEIRQGGTPEVEPWHDDDKHNLQHYRQLNSDEIREWNDTARKYLIMHTEKHEEQKLTKFKKAAWQMAMMNMGQGGMGGGQGQPSRTSGAPGLAPPSSQMQRNDRTLERQTQMEFPGAPKSGGE